MACASYKTGLPPESPFWNFEQTTIMKISLIKTILTSLLVAGAANAVPITGTINISSYFDPSFSFNTSDVGPGANSVTFGAGPNSSITGVSGSYSGLLPVGPAPNVRYYNFTYAPFVGPIAPLWQTTSGPAASFNLTSITGIDETIGLGLTGTGIAFLQGYDPTPGSWTFTASANGGTFSFDSINSPERRVPDGGATLALLGVGVLGLGGMRRLLPSAKK